MDFLHTCSMKENYDEDTVAFMFVVLGPFVKTLVELQKCSYLACIFYKIFRQSDLSFNNKVFEQIINISAFTRGEPCKYREETCFSL
jgi:hypothetical protein